MIHDHTHGRDAAAGQIGGVLPETVKLRGHWTFAYYDGDWTPEQIDAGLAGPPILVEGDNILVNVGIQLMLDLLIGAGGTVFDNTNAYIGIGDDATAAAASQTDLQAASNKVRVGMDASYPQRTSQTMSWRTTYSTAQGNFHIQEVGLFNASSAGTMFNRLVQDLGTKTSATTLQVTLNVTIS